MLGQGQIKDLHMRGNHFIDLGKVGTKKEEKFHRLHMIPR